LNPPGPERKLTIVAFSLRSRRPALPSREELAARRPARVTYGAGNYVGCSACGRLLKIEWAVRSLVCSCGARVDTTTLRGK
jgi:hypothetical protein